MLKSIFFPVRDKLFVERFVRIPNSSCFDINLYKKELENKKFFNILEVSTKSDVKLGRKLSAFNLKYNDVYYLESVYQGSKFFERCGNNTFIYQMEPYDAKKYVKTIDSKIIKFKLYDKEYPKDPPNAFYDWLYINCLKNHEEWLKKNMKYRGYSDMMYNPETMVNAQSRSVAIMMSLIHRGEFQKCVENFDYFVDMINERI